MLDIYKSSANMSAAAGMIFHVADMAEVNEEQVICFILAQTAFGMFDVAEAVSDEAMSELEPGMDPAEVEEAVPDEIFEEVVDRIALALSQAIPAFLMVRSLSRDPALRELCQHQAKGMYDLEKSNMGEMAHHARLVVSDPVLSMFRKDLIETANRVEESLKSEGESDVDLSDIDLPEL